MAERVLVRDIVWTIRDVLLKLRAINHLEQEDVAALAHVSVSTVRRLEQGEKIGTRNLEKITAAFGFENPYAMHEKARLMNLPTAPTPPSEAPVRDVNLAKVIARWPELLETTRESVLALVEHDGGRFRGGSTPGGGGASGTPETTARTPPSNQARPPGRRQGHQ